MSTDRNRLRLLCAAQAYLPSEVVVALLDQLDAAEGAAVEPEPDAGRVDAATLREWASTLRILADQVGDWADSA